jgi:hypothetical protein
LALLVACSDDNATSAPLAAVGLSGLTQNYDASEASWRAVLDRATEAGVSFVHLQAPPWPEVEQAPGEFALPDFDAFFAIESDYALEYTLDISTPLGLGSPAVPADVTFESFGDADLETRYRAYVRYLITAFPNTKHVVLHTETVGPYFDNDDESPEFIAFCQLVNDTARFARELEPDLSVAVYGTANESPAILGCLNRDMDYFGISSILDRGDEPFEELTNLAAQAGDSPIGIVEAGFPTAARVAGSEAGQVDYVDKLFALRERLGEQLLFVSYYQVFDEDQAITRMYAPVLFPNFSEDDLEDFVQWSSSLGLHRVDRTPKPAWSTFTQHVRE